MRFVECREKEGEEYTELWFVEGVWHEYRRGEAYVSIWIMEGEQSSGRWVKLRAERSARLKTEGDARQLQMVGAGQYTLHAGGVPADTLVRTAAVSPALSIALSLR